MNRRLRGLLGIAFVVTRLVVSAHGNAQTADELASGRQLFAAALDDEDHHRLPEALDKYKRVLLIKDTAAIRYRIGVTLEGLGRINEAIDSHTAAVRMAGTEGKEADVGRAAKARVDALEPRVAHLALRVAPAAGAEVRVDDRIVPAEALSDVRLDPGPHVVTATAPEAQPFKAQLTLSEGGRAELPVTLAAAATAPPPPPPPPPASSSLPTIGVVTGAAGGALLVAGLVVMALRSAAISDLDKSCPGGNCPIDRRSELESTHSRAQAETTAGAVLLVTGAVALATGAVLVLLGRSDAAKTARSGLPWMTSGAFAMGGSFR